ncbi:MAG: hypothetical protein QG568_98 [Patescibacteria group bacterium]|nr:hypothetical protein [Patescibacteria group bacterium]
MTTRRLFIVAPMFPWLTPKALATETSNEDSNPWYGVRNSPSLSKDQVEDHEKRVRKLMETPDVFG